ncbi:MAG: MBL fold metallo-hydrolase [Nitrospirae bacterium]|nr:MBL fold metallo-hydrolase [Nitrospirota bacterium]
MKIKFWGTRGSIPTPGRRTEKYGGNTSCVEIRTDDGQILVCDAGTGIRELGQSLLTEFKDKPIEAHVFISHTHWDHIQGIPFFTPAFQSGNAFTFHGPGDIKGALHGQMSNTYFPVPLTAMGGKLHFVSLQPGSRVHVGKVQVLSAGLTHPGGAIGYRFTLDNHSVAYITDNELAPIESPDGPIPPSAAALADFVRDVDLMIADTQYTKDEYHSGKKGWGHSIIDDVLRLAAHAHVKALALFHHDPTHSDEFMDQLFQSKAAELSKQGVSMECFVAREGLAIQV